MKAIAIFLLLVNYFTSCNGWTCNSAPQQRGAVQLDAGQGMVVITDKSSKVFSLSGKEWVKLGSVPLKHVSVGPAGIWGVNNDDQLYKLSGGDFVPVCGPKLNQLDAGGEGHVVGVTDKGSIHCLSDVHAPTAAELKWDTFKGKLIYTSCGPNTCWGVNTRENIYFSKISSNTCDITSWTKTEGELVKVEVGSDGRVFGVNQYGKVYERDGISDKQPGGDDWRAISDIKDTIKHVSYDQGHLWVLTECGEIKKCTN